MDTLLRQIALGKAEFDRYRPLARDALRGLRKYHDVELIHTSNAIEGNTLTLRETAEVIGHGITVGIPELMQRFGAWLETAPLEPLTAFDAHFRLTAIHPFGDGNGRTARLLMNLILLRDGYPAVAVRPEARKSYLDALERASLADDLEPSRMLLLERLDATLDAYLAALREAMP